MPAGTTTVSSWSQTNPSSSVKGKVSFPVKSGYEIKGCSIANEFLRKGALVSSFSSRKHVCTSLISIMGSSQSLLQPLPHLAGCPRAPCVCWQVPSEGPAGQKLTKLPVLERSLVPEAQGLGACPALLLLLPSLLILMVCPVPQWLSLP